MDILEILQTIGICVGSLALVAIAVMIFLVVTTFVPAPGDFNVLDMDEFLDEDEPDETPKRRRRSKR